ncbi:MAG: hypothetical protein ACK5QT_11315, partial [Oligoflexia bacterium]
HTPLLTLSPGKKRRAEVVDEGPPGSAHVPVSAATSSNPFPHANPFPVLGSAVPTMAETTVERDREPKLGSFDKFKGQRDKFRAFKRNLKIHFTLNPSRFPTDQTKILFVGANLDDFAAEWFDAQLDLKDLETMTFDEFFKKMDSCFGDHHSVESAQRKLRSMSQGKSSASVYSAKFLSCAYTTGFNNAALVAQFRAGLNDDIKDALAYTRDAPTSLHELIDYVIEIDNLQFQRRKERNRGSAFRPRSAATPAPPTKSNPDVVPMDLSAVSSVPHGPLSKEEKERRKREGLCLYCGLDGHMVLNCPTKPKNESRPRK